MGFMSEHRAHKVEKERVKHLCHGGYASGGAVKEHTLVKKVLASHEAQHEALKGEGKKPKARGDRVKRAKGGRVKHRGHSGKTNVNVIVAPKGGDGAGAPPPMAGLAPHPAPPPMAPPPAAPPMAAKPPMMPPPGAGGPPGAPPMPMRKKGGRVAHDTKMPVTRAKGVKGKIEDNPKLLKGPTTNALRGPTVDKAGAMAGANADAKRFRGVTDRKKGGRVSENGGMNGADKQGRTGIGFRLPVQHSGNKDDTQNIGRKKPVTYAKGGKVKDANELGGEKQYSKAVSFDSKQDGDGDKPAGGRKQYGDGWNLHAHGTAHTMNRATGGPIYADGKENVGMGPDYEAGSRSGIGRLKKAKDAAKNNHV